MRILIVDDHALVRDGVRALLADHAVANVVGEAGDARSALEAIESLRPELVLMDVGMRGGDGIELASRVRERHPGVAVLILSMYDNPEFVRQAEQAGAQGYVLKDAPSSDILAAIDAVAAGQRYFSPGLTPAAGGERPSAALSERECDILRGLAQGLSSKQLAAQFELSVRTVETHRQNIRRKLRIAGQAELIRYACEHFSGQAVAPRSVDAA